MRKFPLFIIDTSRAHGRGRETDFIACTSKEIPWVGEVTLLNLKELAIDQDWESKNKLCVYSEDNGAGIRAKLKVLDYPADCHMPDLRVLMRKGMREWLIRRQPVYVDMEDISNEAIVKFCGVLKQQAAENARVERDDPHAVKQAKMVTKLLDKIINDYTK